MSAAIRLLAKKSFDITNSGMSYLGNTINYLSVVIPNCCFTRIRYDNNIFSYIGPEMHDNSYYNLNSIQHRKIRTDVDLFFYTMENVSRWRP
jgi:hypothetical protein